MHELIGRIYEAAAFPARWPKLLQDIADTLGARGAVIVAGEAHREPRWLASPGFQRDMEDFVGEGWLSDPEYAAPLFKDIHPGFSCPIDFYTDSALDSVRVYAEFMKPRQLIGAAGTILQGCDDQAVQVSFEGFVSHAAAHAAIARLDLLRPHLARAVSLSAQLRLEQARVTIDALERLDVAAAVVGMDGRPYARSALFEARLGEWARITPARLRFRDKAADDMFVAVLASHGGAQGAGRSFVVRRGAIDEAVALHMLPLKGEGERLFGLSGYLLLAVGAGNRTIPGADLLRLMFDLTPAEARLTRLLVAGQTLAAAAARVGIRESTGRVHLRAIFAKTGVSRQADLIVALSGLSPPRDPSAIAEEISM